ncbi:MAG: hypothetical protein FJ297_01920 [Planctomycetes bacterium]|nr:hypothetical protein [Planctomycetota bacterium]
MRASSMSISDFLQLAVQSGLATAAQCRQWQVEYQQQAIGVGADDSEPFAQWLAAQSRMSRYQAKVLLAGRAGPFLYGAYRLIEKAGDGPWDECFRGQHAESGYPVLMQFISGELTRDPRVWSALEPWLVRLTTVGHPCLHAWFEYQTAGAYKFMVFEDLVGQSLDQVIPRQGFEPQRACWIARQIAEGLRTLHREGIVFGQLRPDQVWQDRSGACKLTLHALAPQLAATQGTSALIRSDYLAPELARSGKSPDIQTDVYALGCVLYHLLAGRAPFEGGTVDEKMARHASEAIQPLDTRGVPPALCQLVTYLMAKNPAVRFKTLDDVLPRLAGFAGDEAHRLPPRPAPPGERAFWQYLRGQAARSPIAPAPMSAATAPPTGSAAPYGSYPPPAAPRMAGPQASLAGAVAFGQPAVASSFAPQAGPIPSGLQAVPIPQYPGASGVETAAPPMTPSPFTHPVATPGTGVPLFAASASRPAIDIRTQKSRRRRSNPWTALVAALSVIAIGGSLAYVWVHQTPTASGDGSSDNGESARAGDANRTDSTTKDGQTEPSNGRSGNTSLTGSASWIDDDGKSLWASPTSGRPIDLTGIPSNPLLIVSIRPSDLASHAEGPRLVKALGPWFEARIADWTAESAIPWEDVERLVVSVHAGDSGSLHPAFVAHLRNARLRGELIEFWGNPGPESVGDETIHKGTKWAYYVPPPIAAPQRGDRRARADEGAAGSANSADAARTVVMASESLVRSVAERRGEAPPPPNGTDPLLRVSDDQRLATVLFSAEDLRTVVLREGRKLDVGTVERLRAPLESLLSDDARGVMMSVHLDQQLYVELAVTCDAERDREQVATDLRERVAALSQEVAAYLARVPPSAYWRPVAQKYPGMVRFLYEQTRARAEGDIAMLNARLPDAAAHNLAFGAEMLLSSDPEPAGNILGKRSESDKPIPTSLEEMLEQKLTVRFEDTALDAAMASMVRTVREAYPGLSFEFEIILAAKEILKDGVAKNQPIGAFAVEDGSVGEILTSLVLRANPNASIRDPSNFEQRLIWVVGEDLDNGGKKVILVTTRDAAADNGIAIPKVFEAQP